MEVPTLVMQLDIIYPIYTVYNHQTRMNIQARVMVFFEADAYKKQIPIYARIGY